MTKSTSDGSRPEFEAIEAIAKQVGSPRSGEAWIGDDTAVINLDSPRQVLFASDLVVEGVHFDRSISTLQDVGWKAMAVNVSDLAAMGGQPDRVVVSVAGANPSELDQLYEGLLEAAQEYGCAIVGGDLSSSPHLVICLAVIGTSHEGRPVMRSGAGVGDSVFVTGALGCSAAGRRRLVAGEGATDAVTQALVTAHRRPQARLEEGQLAAKAGATAMIDVSDGFAIDLHRLVRASGVGFVLDEIPIGSGATIEDALFGGEDYELIFTAAMPDEVIESFGAQGQTLPHVIGKIVADPTMTRLRDHPLQDSGYVHTLD